MNSLQQKFNGSSGVLLCGVELVTTRGTLRESKALHTRKFAGELVGNTDVDWVSITDNAGGNPQLNPMALGKIILYAGKDVLIHLSCKDFNRNGLESAAWQLASEGFHNILALTGDYPVSGYRGHAKPVFDIDSVALLSLFDEMNQGLGVALPARNGNSASRKLQKTEFYCGAVTTNFKLCENEVVPQLLKLKKKVEAGARFIINQIGFDARKCSELIAYMKAHGMGEIPLIGNIFLMNARLAQFFHRGKIPGVVVSDTFQAYCQKAAQTSDNGKHFFQEFAAKQMAIFRGLGYRGVYFGGLKNANELSRILEIERSFSTDDWKQFAKEIQFSRPHEFFYYARNEDTKLADVNRLEPKYEASFNRRKPSDNVTVHYKFSKWFHDQVFTPGKPLFNAGRKIYESSKRPDQGPPFLRAVEHMSKAALFGCKDCGDCSLPDSGYLCPESACAKNQRNGPCGGTHAGYCEIGELECIWARTYDRLKAESCEENMLAHAPVIQDQSLRGTSSWSNTFRGIDHHKLSPQQIWSAGSRPKLSPS